MIDMEHGGVRQWLRSWWLTIRHGSPLTSAGRELRRSLGDGPDGYVEVERPRVESREDEELLDSEGHEHRASWLHDGDLFCEPGMDAHIVGRREDHGDTVLITDTEGIEISLDSDTVVSVVTSTRLQDLTPNPKENG